MTTETGTTSEVARVLGEHTMAEMGRARAAQDAQIAAPVPAGEEQATSGGRGASGGVGGACGSAYALGGLVEHVPLQGVTEGRCLTCPGGYGRHKVGGEYPELPHDVVLETKPENEEAP